MAVPTATGKSSLADQTVAFLMSLLEFAASRQRCLVVLTLAGESDTFAAGAAGRRVKPLSHFRAPHYESAQMC